MADGRRGSYMMDIIVKRIAFDLDETLGVPLIEDNSIVGFQIRPGCLELLGRLRGRFTLLLHWQLLLEVGSHDRCGMCWWDAGRLQFLIDSRHLAAGDFSRTYACVQTS